MNVAAQLFAAFFRALRCRCRRGVRGIGPPEPRCTRDHRVARGSRRSGGERFYSDHWCVLPCRVVAGALAGDVDSYGRPSLCAFPLHHRAGVPSSIDLLRDLPRKIHRASQPAIFQRPLPRSVCLDCAGPGRRRRDLVPGRMGADDDRQLPASQLRVRARRELARRLCHAGHERGRHHLRRR